MKPLLFIFCAVFMTGLVSCKGKSAVNYNNKIVSVEDSLLAPVERTEAAISKFADAGHWDSIAVVSQRMEDMFDVKIKEIRDLSVPDLTDAEDFKKEALRYFGYLQGIYTGYRKVATQTTDEARTEEYKKFTEMVSTKSQVVATFQAAQQRFAKANGMRIAPRSVN